MTSRPRIHWVSPLPPAQTDIAEYTRRILPDLAARAEVVLWTSAADWDPSLERLATVRRFDLRRPLPMDLHGLPPLGNGAETIFFNMGNSWEFHSDILALARRVPGVVILHDVAMQEALRDMVLNGLLTRDVYLGEAQRWYGRAGLRLGRRLLAGVPPAPDDLDQLPMFEAALPAATAVLTHTPLGAERASARRILPVYRLELPYAIGPAGSPERAPDGPLRLVQFGHIGPNRRLLQIIDALGEAARTVDFRFEVFGRIWDPDCVRAAARQAGIADRITVRGFAPEAELDAAIAHAHLVFNLRHPTMGEASGSQLRIWNASALAAVTDLGWYASLPDETVAKIPLDDERGAIVRLVERLDADRAMCARIGAAGRTHLEAAHGTDRYADGIAAIAHNAPMDARARLTADALHRLVTRSVDPRAFRTAAERLVPA